MESKNITLESSINFQTAEEFENYICSNLDYVREKIKIINEQNRVRENARALVEEVRRTREERLVFETCLSAHLGSSRPNLFDAQGDYIFRRNKNNK